MDRAALIVGYCQTDSQAFRPTNLAEAGPRDLDDCATLARRPAVQRSNVATAGSADLRQANRSRAHLR